jgi:hypothetical protein
MGIGRRDFLKFVGMALAGIVVDPLRAIAVNGNYYVNMRLGLGFEKPDGWRLEGHNTIIMIPGRGIICDSVRPTEINVFFIAGLR